VRKHKGFTLIELLVVIAVIALLLSILMPALSKAKELAMGAACKGNLKNFTFAMATLKLTTAEKRFTSPGRIRATGLRGPRRFM